MVSQTVIKEIAPPGYFVDPSQILFPIRDGCFHSRLAREGNDSMQMVRH